ncbi:MAG: hypothetical protein WDO73_11435 [Ignavibacteriota bacterium]
MLPGGAVIDRSGNLLIAETGANRIRQVAFDGRIRTVVGTGWAGLGTDSQPPTQTQLRSPRGICLDRSGNLYVVDTGNHRVLLVPAAGMVATAAGNGGQGSGGDGGPAPLAQLNQPAACAADSTGSLYIADTYNHSIRKVDPTGAIVTLAGTGIAGNSGDEGPASSAQLNTPRGVAVDDNGNVFISDTGNSSIRQVTPDGVIHTIAGNGLAGFAGDGGPALSASLDSPGGLVLDGSGDLYFADTNNNRVRRLIPTELAPIPTVDPPAQISVVNAASLAPGPVAPGEVVTIFGSDMGPQTGVSALIDPAAPLGAQLAGVVVLFDGVPAPLFYVQASQINAQAPYSIAGQAITNIQVIFQGAVVNSVSAMVAEAAPGVFPTAINQDGSFNSVANPAVAGSYVTIYATGAGLSDGWNIAGQPAAAPYALPVLPVTATIAGVSAPIAWAGSAPGLIGMLQVNLIVPGPYLPSGAAPLQLTVGTVVGPSMALWVQ